jgi:hypothetical protein
MDGCGLELQLDAARDANGRDGIKFPKRGLQLVAVVEYVAVATSQSKCLQEQQNDHWCGIVVRIAVNDDDLCQSQYVQPGNVSQI